MKAMIKRLIDHVMSPEEAHGTVLLTTGSTDVAVVESAIIGDRLVQTYLDWRGKERERSVQHRNLKHAYETGQPVDVEERFLNRHTNYPVFVGVASLNAGSYFHVGCVTFDTESSKKILDWLK